MMYWDYPRGGPQQRLERAQAIKAEHVRLSADEAHALLGLSPPPDEVHLAMFDGRPLYRFRTGRDNAFVYADNGQRQTKFPADLALRVASSWTGLPSNLARLDTLTAQDQWTVAGSFRAHRPLSRFSFPNGEEVYVSASPGEVVQHTTRASRIGAYLGAIPHWLYFTPLRKNQGVWTKVVIWLSAAGTVMALLGLIAGIWMYSPARRYKFKGVPSRIPYQGQERLHTILGLFFGVVTITWGFSGMMSMNPFPGPGRQSSQAESITLSLREENFLWPASLQSTLSRLCIKPQMLSR